MKANRRQAAFLFGAALVSGLLCSVALAGNPHGTAPGQTTTTSSSNSSGVKPSSTTAHNTHASAGSNKTKQYGNGKTAGQIAEKNGASPGTDLYGPGNSQPHKICGRDVHAYNKGNSKKCPSSSQSGTQSSASKNGSLEAAGTNGTGSTAGTSASSGNPSSSTGVLGASHTTRSKPVAARAKPAHAVLGTASFTG